MAAILELTGVTKNFGSVRALSNVSFELESGEIHCLVGENGAGKSTLIKILSGAIAPTSGTIRIHGEIYKSLTPALARKLETETIYQENIICPDMTAMENIYLGTEYRHGILFDKKKTLVEAKKLIDTMEVNIDPLAMLRSLSPAQQKVVQVLKAFVKKAKILILDEPTASFSMSEIETLLNIIKKVKLQGTGIIFISHHLDEVFKIADRVTVLKDGEIISTHKNGEYTSDILISDMTGRNPSTFFKKRHHRVGETVLEVKNFSRKNVVRNVSFDLKRGEVLGFAGMVGSGRSELARLIFGADRKTSGMLVLNGKETNISNPRNAIKHGICFLPEDRKRDANVNYQSVADNIVISYINSNPALFRNIGYEKKESKNYIDLLKIKTPSESNSINNLSGGNQQKVIIARWLLVNSQVFIFDEPTRGIDVGSKEEIYRLMNDLAGQGKSIIMISSELPELIAMSDRVLIMKNGTLAGEVSGSDINEETILSYSIGANKSAVSIN